MIMLFNQLLDMPHLSGGWIILAKEKCSPNKDVNNFVHRNKLIVRMEHFWDLLFQLMKHGIKTVHVEFIFLFRVEYRDYRV